MIKIILIKIKEIVQILIVKILIKFLLTNKRILILNINNIFWVCKKVLVLIPKLTLVMGSDSKKMLFLKKKIILKFKNTKLIANYPIKYKKINLNIKKILKNKNNFNFKTNQKIQKIVVSHSIKKIIIKNSINSQIKFVQKNFKISKHLMINISQVNSKIQEWFKLSKIIDHN